MTVQPCCTTTSYLDFSTGGGCERLTPTAAAFLTRHTTDFVSPARFTTSCCGYGAGRADPEQGPPNLVRVQLGCAAGELGDAGRAVAWRLEVNLDDMTAEEVGHALGRLRQAGALEVWSSPVSMKKDRQAVLVSALAREDRRGGLLSGCPGGHD